MKKILLINSTTFILLMSYSLLNVKDCVAYWMHDGSIEVNHNNILMYCLYSFLLPIIAFYFLQKLNPKKRIQKIFIFQYLLALFSILSLFISILNPIKTQIVDNTTFIFTSSYFTFSYYVFNFLNIILLGIIILKIILNSIYNYTNSIKNLDLK
jgi:chromate transport protein ChrA